MDIQVTEWFNINEKIIIKKKKNILKYMVKIERIFNPLGTGDLKFYQYQGLIAFWGLFQFFLLNQSFICHGSPFSSLFTIR